MRKSVWGMYWLHKVLQLLVYVYKDKKRERAGQRGWQVGKEREAESYHIPGMIA